MVKDGAVVVDVANGDIDFASVAPKCSYITPTFGGIGPMTIASLLYNLSQV
jgi:methylenetetrahydrofolate dehydrogenase (NADP+)/methenyltetrahydrofolate cyclohydrolase